MHDAASAPAVQAPAARIRLEATTVLTAQHVASLERRIAELEARP